LFEYVREDMRRALSGNQHDTGAAAVLRELLNPGTQAVLVYRLGRWIHGLRIPVVRPILKVFFMILQYFVSWRVGIFIPVTADIGPGLLIHTWGGGIFFPSAPIGRHLTIIGGGVQMDYEMIGIGEEVSIAPGTKMIGKIRIGDRARTGPNSVVQTDVPADCVVIGNPGRVIGPVPRLTYEQGAKRIVPKAMAGANQGQTPPPSPAGSPNPSQPQSQPQSQSQSQPQSPSPVEGALEQPPASTTPPSEKGVRHA
jgi:serine O-acetyltransferase